MVNEDGHPAKFYDDTGYTKICARCGERHSEVKEQLGKRRDLDIEMCKDCVGITKGEAARRKLVALPNIRNPVVPRSRLRFPAKVAP